jgi:hypothetical protein
MNLRVFRSFIKTAVALQTDATDSTPPGYKEVRAAVANRYPDLEREEPRPNKIINDPEQVKLAKKLNQQALDKILWGGAAGGGVGAMAGHAFHPEPKGENGKQPFWASNDTIKKRLPLYLGGTAAGAGLGAYLHHKHASTGRHLMELGGLATLAAPSVQELRHKPMSEKRKAGLEVAGLGTLAAPYVHDLAMKNPHYAGAAGKVLSRFHR